MRNFFKIATIAWFVASGIFGTIGAFLTAYLISHFF